MDKDEDSFYDRYFFHLWLLGSFLFCLFYIYVIEGVEISVENLFPGVFALLAALPFIAIFIYCLFVLFTFGCSVFIDGIKEKDPGGILGAFWLLLGVILYMIG